MAESRQAVSKNDIHGGDDDEDLLLLLPARGDV